MLNRLLNNPNYTVRDISGMVSLVLFIVTFLFFYFMTGDALPGLLFAGVLAVVTFFMLMMLLHTFLYKKLRLVYKFILTTKNDSSNQSEIKKDLSRKSIEEVQHDVLVWSEGKNMELQRLKENNAYRKEFLQNLSHELKTPIFSIQGFIETLQEGAIHDKDVALKFLESANKGVERLVSLTESIDSIAKLESGIIEMKDETFNIYDLIQDVYHELELEAKKSKVELILPEKGTEKIRAMADQAQIKQVLVNLVQNGIKYCDEGNKITARIFKIDNKNMLVEIADNGPGMDEEHVKRVFERFYRTDASRARNIGGTGLGLAISKHIIEAHKQTITCRSQKDVGTTFGFTLALN